jgi:hypothetical protein
MIKDILQEAENVDIVKIIDTDSLFIQVGKGDNLQERITAIEDYVNSEMLNFMDMHNMNRTETVKMFLKNEFYLPRLVAFSKKRYIGVTYDAKKDKKKIEIRGIEGRRATTKFILDVVKHLETFVLSGCDIISLKSIFYDVFKKIETAFCTFDIAYISMPINPPKSFSELKSIQSPARGMINFDIMIEPVFTKMYAKGLHIPIYISEEEIMNNKKLRTACDNVIKKYESFDAIKLKRLKRDTDESFFSRTISDITIPEIQMTKDTLDKINSMGIKIDFIAILQTFITKFGHLFSPMFVLDKEFNFESECSKVRDYVIQTYYEV